MPRTYLVECFWPGVTEAAHALATARARSAASSLRAEGREVRFIDSALVATDEVAFYRFAAESIGDAEAAGVRAQLPFERVLEYFEGPRGHDSTDKEQDQ